MDYFDYLFILCTRCGGEIFSRIFKIILSSTFYYKIIDLLNYTPIQYQTKMNGFDKMGGSGLEAVILAYDNLLLSAKPDNKVNPQVDIINPEFDWYTLFFNNVFFFGDNDSIGAISGAWYGAFLGIDKFPLNKIKDLEFYNELKKNIVLFIKN